VEKILTVNKVFLDCDIILDFITGRLPFAEPANALFSLAEHKIISLCTSSLTYSHLFYLLRKTIPAESLRETLKTLTILVEPLMVDGTTIKAALELDFTDFEDAIQECTAKAAAILILITRNVKDYRKSKLVIKTPGEFLKTFS
jgi:predicted nucleic acid-binding protein